MKIKKNRDKLANQEKAELLSPERVKEQKKKKRKKILWIIFAILFGILVIVLSSFQVMRALGKNKLQNNTETVVPEMKLEEAEPLTEDEEVRWQEGWVKYHDTIYEYNQDMLTFLVMGIDKDTDVKATSGDTNGGQADALFLVALNPRTNTMSIIGINRNSMAAIDIYTEDGSYVNTVTAQIAVQHGFGNGLEESCERQVQAVQRMLYNLPIHGYAAINMKAIPAINDSVGGVSLEVLEDVESDDKSISLKKGEYVHLEGNQAYIYVRDRQIDVFGSADLRLLRQKQYLTEFVKSAKQALKNNIGVASELYQTISKQMVTNVTLDEVAYIAPSLKDYQFGSENFYSIKGETTMGEKFEEFYIDEDALYELILQVFYEEVKF